jgi:hypothetical protein
MKRAPRRTASTRSARMIPPIRFCERCRVNLSLELTRVLLETPDGDRLLCAMCTRWVLDALDTANSVAFDLCENLWGISEDLP